MAAYNLANCYFFLDRLPEAAENYELALELDPRQPDSEQLRDELVFLEAISPVAEPPGE